MALSHLQKLCRTGQIRVNGSRVVYNQPLVTGDEIKLPPFINEYDKEVYSTPKNNYTQTDFDNILKTIIYEDDEIIVINKPAGLATQGGTGLSKHVDTLMNAALPQYVGNLRLVHRIDLETTGALIIAKTYEAANKYSTMFRSHLIKKTYLALVYGNIETKQGTIKSFIEEVEDANGNKSIRTNARKNENSKYAITDYKIIDEAFGMLSLLKLQPLTGRKHQLRIHLKSIGNPILGDFKYARSGEFQTIKEKFDVEIPRQLYLHSYSIEIEGKAKITAPLPKHFMMLCKYLNFEVSDR